MSCLPADALSHFEQREQELVAVNEQLERKRAHLVAKAANAVQGATVSAAGTPQGDYGGTVGASASSEPSHPHGRDSPQALPRRAGSRGGSREVQQEQFPSSPGNVREPSPTGRSRPPTGGGGDTLHTTIKHQVTRISKLQEDLDRALKELSDRDLQIQELQQQNKALQEQSRALQQKKSDAEKKSEDMKNRVSTSEASVKDLQREKAELLKEKQEMEVKLSRSQADCSAKDTRMNHLEEECERNKMALKAAGNQGKDQSASDRREIDRLQGEVRKLERQRSELVGAFKKQMKLIEVLKRQRAHMEAARVLSFTEEEFIRVLELGDRLGEPK